MPKLHVNVDHVATVREARRIQSPDPVEWARMAERAGAHGITCHLRKDRRHIQDDDVRRLREGVGVLFNLECSLDPEMVEIAHRTRPEEVCLVPENRQEVTTEGGLDAIGEGQRLAEVMHAFRDSEILVSLFLDPNHAQLARAAELEADYVELHTGAYANASGAERERELEALRSAAEHAHTLGLRVNAGHGLDYGNVQPIAALPHVEELNIGHSMVGRALFVGVDGAVREMLDLIRAGGR